MHFRQKIVQFFEKNLDKIYCLCQNENIPVEFFEKHLDEVDWYSLCWNTNMPVEFLKRI